MKTLSLLLPLSLLSLSLATPPPDLIESLSSARLAAASSTPAPTPTAGLQRRARRGGSGELFARSVDTFSAPVFTPAAAPGIQGGRHDRQSAPVAHGPHRLVKNDGIEAEEEEEEGVKNSTISTWQATKNGAARGAVAVEDAAGSAWNSTKSASRWVGHKASDGAEKVEEGAEPAWSEAKNGTAAAGRWVAKEFGAAKNATVHGAEKGWNATSHGAGVAWNATSHGAGVAAGAVEHGAGKAWNATSRGAESAWNGTKAAGRWAGEKGEDGAEAVERGAKTAARRVEAGWEGLKGEGEVAPSASATPDHARLARLVKAKRAPSPGVMDDVRSVQQRVEEKLGGETASKPLETVSGKVNGDRNHYWYVDDSPAPAKKDSHKPAPTIPAASLSAHRSAASEVAKQTQTQTQEHGGSHSKRAQNARVAFDRARASAFAARESIKHAHKATRTVGSVASASAKGQDAKNASKEAKKSKGKREEGASTTATGGFVTSTRSSTPSPTTTAAATASPSPAAAEKDAAATSSVDPSLLDPTTWDDAVEQAADSKYQQVKKQIEELSILSKIGLASVIILAVVLLFSFCWCCCKLRRRRNRKRAAERVNASLAAAQNNRRSAGGRSFDERATAIPMGRFGSASGASTKEDKKGKRRGSWRAHD
ncbi:hypothetical protein JCM10213_003376 [Rhodosporidiobolus nylandii]